jgi:hypothetical protein
VRDVDLDLSAHDVDGGGQPVDRRPARGIGENRSRAVNRHEQLRRRIDVGAEGKRARDR